MLAVIILGAAAYLSFFYVPPPMRVVKSIDCAEIGQATSNISSSSIPFLVNGTHLDFTESPVSGLTLSNCDFTSINLTTYFRCGTMCGNGVGSGETFLKELGFSLHYKLTNSNSSYSAVLSSEGSPLTSIFAFDFVEINVNSQQISFSSNDPVCSTLGTDCFTQNSTSLYFNLPPSLNSSVEYNIWINSSETLLP